MRNINTTWKVHQHFQCLEFRPSFLSMQKASQFLCIISKKTVPSYEMLYWQLTLHQKDNFFQDSVHIIQALKMDTQCIIASNDIFFVDYPHNNCLNRKISLHHEILSSNHIASNKAKCLRQAFSKFTTTKQNGGEFRLTRQLYLVPAYSNLELVQ